MIQQFERLSKSLGRVPLKGFVFPRFLEYNSEGWKMKAGGRNPLLTQASLRRGEVGFFPRDLQFQDPRVETREHLARFHLFPQRDRHLGDDAARRKSQCGAGRRDNLCLREDFRISFHDGQRGLCSWRGSWRCLRGGDEYYGCNGDEGENGNSDE